MDAALVSKQPDVAGHCGLIRSQLRRQIADSHRAACEKHHQQLELRDSQPQRPNGFVVEPRNGPRGSSQTSEDASVADPNRLLSSERDGKL